VGEAGTEHAESYGAEITGYGYGRLSRLQRQLPLVLGGAEYRYVSVGVSWNRRENTQKQEKTSEFFHGKKL
jgi:hypothetical protein